MVLIYNYAAKINKIHFQLDISLNNYYFFCQDCVFAWGNEQIEPIIGQFALVGQGIGVRLTDDLELVNQTATHIVNFEVDFTYEVLKVQVHLPMVGIWGDTEG